MDEPVKRNLERLKQIELEMIKATVAFEHAALRPPFLLNGGALVVYLALYGALSRGDSASSFDRCYVYWAMSLWIVGLVVATIATGAGFWSQFSFRRHRGQQIKEAEARDQNNPSDADKRKTESERYARYGEISRKAAFVCVIFSVILFISGVILAFNSLH